MKLLTMKQRQIFDKYPHYFPSPKDVDTPNVSLTSSKSPHQSYLRQFLVTTQQPPHPSAGEKQEHDLHESMKPLIILGRLAFIIPCGQDDATSFKDCAFGWRKLFLLLSFLVAIWISITVVFDARYLVLRGSGGSLGIMQYISSATFIFMSIMELSVHLHFILYADRFYAIFQKWTDLQGTYQFAHDRLLKPLAYFLVLSLIFPVSITITFLVEMFTDRTKDQKYSDTSPLKMFYETMMTPWHDAFPYNPAFVIFYCAMRIWKTISRSFVTPLIIFFSRAIAFQYKKLVESDLKKAAGDVFFENLKNKDKLFWRNLVQKHRAITLMVKVVNRFMGPLIFLWTALNIYTISMQLYRAWAGSTTSWHLPSYVFVQSFAIELMIFLVTILCAAKVNTSARKILLLLENCPKEYYADTEVDRLDRRINSGPNIGLSGWGCYTYTKPFLLKLFNAIFTMEIMLLQSRQSKPNEK